MEICIVAQFHKVSYLLVLFFHYGFYEILHWKGSLLLIIDKDMSYRSLYIMYIKDRDQVISGVFQINFMHGSFERLFLIIFNGNYKIL